MVKVSVLGATGYTGQELVRMLALHPEVALVGLGTQSYVDRAYVDVYPHLRQIVDLTCRQTDDPFLIEQAEVIFLALPHGLSVPYAEKGLAQGKKVIDLGADFRLENPEVYRAWYKKTGPTEELLKQAVYGLPEINRELIKKTKLVANPGCYPTTAILALYPLFQEKLLDPSFLIIDSKSGVSGAGRSLKTTSLYSEANEDFKVYGLPHHRHAPEIEQELTKAAGTEVTVTFTPHLVPVTRGMMSTIYTRPLITDIDKIEEVYREYYSEEPFVRIYPQGQYPQTKWVQGTNFCDLGFSFDARTQRLIIISVIDNLTKGASGQAIQNLNLMCGFEETLGLPQVALFP
ncbi:MAG TPA: N-acetyl-gamma-glutamyl-phosphate reductase [Clostridia bacterium]|jgi:N-acetyl-gamma-glutamyl-phosphate reductase|nr:N-acetyl-gamma-glutamyl-phosphate reductase [Clostridia bacterium]HHY05385.1 N-acetyl-gamma-glutamyl-phosphate reductase [Clostridia bacterium]